MQLCILHDWDLTLFNLHSLSANNKCRELCRDCSVLDIITIIVLTEYFIQLVAVACVNISLVINLSDCRAAKIAMKGLYCKKGHQGDVKFVLQETVRVHEYAFTFSVACIYIFTVS